MKKFLSLFAAAAMLLAFSGCSGDNPPAVDTSGSTAADTVISTPSDISGSSSEEIGQSIDYTVFVGNYSDTDTPEGPCYTVSITSVDNAAGTMELAVFYVGFNASPVYETMPVQAEIQEDHTVHFEWTDSWGNAGNGILVLNPADSASVSLLMTVTQESEANRATLSTHEEYKALTRR